MTAVDTEAAEALVGQLVGQLNKLHDYASGWSEYAAYDMDCIATAALTIEALMRENKRLSALTQGTTFVALVDALTAIHLMATDSKDTTESADYLRHMMRCVANISGKTLSGSRGTAS